MFVASTDNILELKDGIDEETAGARLALKSALSTLSNTSCVEIIEQLLCMDNELMEL